MLELLCIYAIRKANRAVAAQAQAQATPQPVAQPLVVEASQYPPCTRTGCALKFNHTHI